MKTSFYLPLGLLIATGCGHAGSPGPNAGEREALASRVRDTVKGVAHHIDLREWGSLRALYSAEVETDYTSLFGGEVQRQPADELMATWNQLLSPVATQHLLGPIEVSLDGSSATARCHVRGYHFANDAPSGPTWMVAGHYTFKLRIEQGRWRITHMKLDTFYQTGNGKLLQEAASKAEG